MKKRHRTRLDQLNDVELCDAYEETKIGRSVKFIESETAHPHTNKITGLHDSIEESTDATINGYSGEPDTNWKWNCCDPNMLNAMSQLKGSVKCTSDDQHATTLGISDISIHLCKPFMRDAKHGWNWHKSWTLPTISINLRCAKDWNVNKTHTKLNAELLAYTMEKNELGIIKLNNIPLQGASEKSLEDHIVDFSPIKFTSTSHCHEGLKFHLVLSIASVQSGGVSNILEAHISPPIFVDSRKSSRDGYKMKQKRMLLKYTEPFSPVLFSTTFSKTTKRSQKYCSSKIGNNIEGLCDYLIASHIKNKVKHPLYLLQKFSNCFKLYYNTNFVQSNQGSSLIAENVILHLQNILSSKSGSPSKKINETTTTRDRIFCIFLIEADTQPLNSLFLFQKVAEQLAPLNSEHIHFAFKKELVPSFFQEIPTSILEDAYTSIYPVLLKLSRDRLLKERSVRSDGPDLTATCEPKLLEPSKKHLDPMNLTSSHSLLENCKDTIPKGIEKSSYAEQLDSSPKRPTPLFSPSHIDQNAILQKLQNSLLLQDLRSNIYRSTMAIQTINSINPMYIQGRLPCIVYPTPVTTRITPIFPCLPQETGKVQYFPSTPPWNENLNVNFASKPNFASYFK